MAEVLGYGTNLQYGDGVTYAGSSTWTNICAELVEVTPPSFDADDIATKHMTTTSMFETFVAGWGKSGEVEFKGYFTPAEYNTIAALHRTAKGFRVVFSTATSGGASSSAGVTGDIIGWTGYLKTYEVEVDLEGLVMVSGKIKVSGKPTVA